MSPLRLKFLALGANRQRTLNKLDIFNAQKALASDSALKELNKELGLY